MSFKNAKGTAVWYNLEGHGKSAEEVVTKFENVNTFSGLGINVESIKEDDLETQTEVSMAGKITVDDIELSVRITSEGTVFSDLYNAAINRLPVTVKAFIPTDGAGQTFVMDAIVAKVGVPTESNGFMHTNVTFSVSGLPRLVK